MNEMREQFVRDKLENGGLNDHDRAMFTEELERIEASKQQQETIIAAAEEITSSMETFTVGNMEFTLDDLSKDVDCAKILRKGLETISKKQAQKFLDELNTQKVVYDSQLNSKQELLNQLNELAAERDELQIANSQLQLEKDDLAEKRDAAAQQLLEAQAEIARLNSHVDDLRKEIAVGPSNAINVIDITTDAELEAAAQRLKAKKEQADAEKKAAAEAAKVRIYNVRQLDGTGSKFGANRADNNEHIEFNWLTRGQYVELSDEEASRFRSELEAQTVVVEEDAEPVQSDLVVEASVTVPALENTFREDEAVQEYSTNGEMAEKATGSDSGSVEERIAALEMAVFGQAKAAA